MVSTWDVPSLTNHRGLLRDQGRIYTSFATVAEAGVINTEDCYFFALL